MRWRFTPSLRLLFFFSPGSWLGNPAPVALKRTKRIECFVANLAYSDVLRLCVNEGGKEGQLDDDYLENEIQRLRSRSTWPDPPFKDVLRSNPHNLLPPATFTWWKLSTHRPKKKYLYENRKRLDANWQTTPWSPGQGEEEVWGFLKNRLSLLTRTAILLEILAGARSVRCNDGVNSALKPIWLEMVKKTPPASTSFVPNTSILILIIHFESRHFPIGHKQEKKIRKILKKKSEKNFEKNSEKKFWKNFEIFF